MTEPSRPRPVPGPPRPGPGPLSGPARVIGSVAPAPGRPASGGPVTGGPPRVPTATGAAEDEAPFAGLAQRPVAEHVAVFEAEHARLQRELATIDQL
jgi:hypothetical protein